MNEHLERLLHDIDVAVEEAQPTEASAVRAALVVEAIGNAMEGDVPREVRDRVRRFAHELERIAFTSDDSMLRGRIRQAFDQYHAELKTLLNTSST